MKQWILIATAMTFLSACAVDDGVKKPEETDTVSIQTTTKEGALSSFASAIRWNEEYLVSVKHLEEGAGIKRCASDKLDLAFYKVPVKKGETIPSWENMKSGSSVKMEGFISRGKNLKTVEGKVVPGIFTYGGEAKYKLAQNIVTKGMSGGPVKNEDGKIVGLIIGYTAEPVKLTKLVKGGVEKPGERFSVLLPYSSISEGWQEVQSKLQTKQCVI